MNFTKVKLMFKYVRYMYLYVLLTALNVNMGKVNTPPYSNTCPGHKVEKKG